MEQTPSLPEWEIAFQAWIDFALADLEWQYVASPPGLNEDAKRLLARARQDLNQMLESIRSALTRGEGRIDWSAKAGPVDRMTPSARAGLAELEAQGRLPLPVEWPMVWARWRDRDINDPNGWRTPPTLPSTPPQDGDSSSSDDD